MREIARYRYKLVCMRSSERNRYQSCMTVPNIGLASVVFDPFGKTASNIMKEVMKSNVIDDDKILKLVHKNCKNKDKIPDSLHGYRIESDQRFMRSGIDQTCVSFSQIFSAHHANKRDQRLIYHSHHL